MEDAGTGLHSGRFPHVENQHLDQPALAGALGAAGRLAVESGSEHRPAPGRLGPSPDAAACWVVTLGRYPSHSVPQFPRL